MTRILVTGAGGQLGSELTHATPPEGTVITAPPESECDITDASSVARALHGHEPDVLINCAAWTDVDGAERHADAAFAVNATGPAVLATACARNGVLLVHMSTDYVFDGRSRDPIDEDTPPAPLSVYGRSKLAGEREVQIRSPNHCIVRTSGLYGRNGPNFVLAVLQRAAAGELLDVVADQSTSPTWTRDLARAVLRLIALDARGVVHLTNTGSTTWHGFAKAAVAATGLAVPVRETTLATRSAGAARPQHSVLENRRWRLLGQPPLPPWEAALAGYVAELRERRRLPVLTLPGPGAGSGTRHP